MNTTPESNLSRPPAAWLKSAAWLFYVAIGLEILFMISPAALYFYSLYGPSLNALDHFASTAWLTQFFLPHLSTTHSLVLNMLPMVGGLCVLVGAAWFLAAAGQLYWSKFRSLGMVTHGLYALSRHPQYTALALLGLGALLLWPRFLVLIVYVLMLFLYRALAATEERECEWTFGEPYRAYQARTPRILPYIPHFLRPAAIPAVTSDRSPLAQAALGAIGGIAVAVLIAFALREYSLSQITALYDNHVAVLSPARLSENELRAAYHFSLKDPAVRNVMLNAGDEPLVIHVVPANWHLADLPLDIAPERGGHDTPANFDRRHYKLLFSRPRSHEPRASWKDIVRSAYGLTPLLLVRVDIAAREVTAVETPPSHVWWG
ncbi:MAG: uncharacterized protein H6R26_2724, partial [Proteobacteria bacterium]|nr:uncharacterized protein [Pseudomonadota bacterium]